MTTIAEWTEEIHEYAKKAGWWDDPEGEGRSPAMLFVLVHSEISEALEEYRDGRGLNERYYNAEKPTKPEGIPSELADAVIRILDMCAHWGIDLDAVMREKHEYNLTRGYKHGGKKF